MNKPNKILKAIEENGIEENGFITIKELELLEIIEEDDFYKYLDQDLTRVKNILPKPVFRKNGKIFVNKNLLSNKKDDLCLILEHNKIEKLVRSEYNVKFTITILICFLLVILSSYLTYIYALNFVELNIILDTDTIKQILL